ncbi:hypothetical protein S40288_04381 [Stachybotrys chartarum IBT 40288]|nr:hypothetical protein S40288_04381 [Stachybotrys chartarum IBT 40288]
MSSAPSVPTSSSAGLVWIIIPTRATSTILSVTSSLDLLTEPSIPVSTATSFVVITATSQDRSEQSFLPSTTTISSSRTISHAPATGDLQGDSSSNDVSVSPGAIIGAVIGGLVVVCGTIIAAIYLLRKRTRSKPSELEASSQAPSPALASHGPSLRYQAAIRKTPHELSA